MPHARIRPSDLAYARPDALLDVRPIAAYNGWPPRESDRGGHLPGARPFPLAWLIDAPRDELREALVAKGAAPGASVVVYGHDDDEAAAAADRLQDLGILRVTILAGGQPAWAADPDRPLERMARWEHLVPPEWVNAMLAGLPVIAPPGRRRGGRSRELRQPSRLRPRPPARRDPP